MLTTRGDHTDFGRREFQDAGAREAAPLSLRERSARSAGRGFESATRDEPSPALRATSPRGRGAPTIRPDNSLFGCASRGVTGEGPYGEVTLVQAIVEHGRSKEDAAHRLRWPRTVVALHRLEPFDAAFHRVRIRTDQVHQGKKCPACHDNLTLGVLDILIGQAAGIVLAPTAVRALFADQPIGEAT